MTALAMRGDRRPVWRGSAWTRGIGLVMIGFGWVYPHFLEGPAIDYLYASPVGLVPCPTLAVAIGFALLGNGLGSRAWALTIGAVALRTACSAYCASACSLTLHSWSVRSFSLLWCSGHRTAPSGERVGALSAASARHEKRQD